MILDWREALACLLRLVYFAAVVAILMAFIALTGAAQATWRPQYASADPTVRAWYEQAELTKAAAHRLGFWGCCKYSDVVRAKFKLEQVNGAPQWWWLHGDKWEQIPADIIHWNEQAPDNRPTLFALSEEFNGWPKGDVDVFLSAARWILITALRAN